MSTVTAIETASAQTAAPTVKTISLPTGVTLPYVEQGDPAGAPVVLLHGITDSWRSFEPVLPHLPPSIHAFALALRGHGDADRPAGDYRPGDFAADVAAFVDALGLGPVVVAGHSMGSTVAQRFALDYPARTCGLVLIATFRSYRQNKVFVETCESVAALRDPIDPAFVRDFQESTVAKPMPPAFLDTVVGESLKVPARVWRAGFAGLLEEDLSQTFHRITVPTLIVWGDQDVFRTRGDQDAIAAAVPRSRLVVYAGVGHAVHWDDPAGFAADLVGFVQGPRA